MTDTSPEPRPRPQYGEYATPEEQRARIRQPDASHVLDGAPGPTSEDVAPARAAAPASVPSQPRARTVDRIVTVALLAYGLVNVTTSIASFLDYGAYAGSMLDVMGVDAELSDPAAGAAWGIAAALVLGVGWILTAVLSWSSMRRGRLSWWIPLVGGVVFTLAAGTLVVIPLMNDPGVWNALLDSVR